MYYTLSLTSRMLTIAAICLVLLCVLMFLLGMEIGRSLVPREPVTVSIPVPAPVLNAIPKEPPIEAVK
jgi:hypothetical protein